MERYETCGVKLDRLVHRKSLLDGVVLCQECAMIPPLPDNSSKQPQGKEIEG